MKKDVVNLYQTGALWKCFAIRIEEGVTLTSPRHATEFDPNTFPLGS